MQGLLLCTGICFPSTTAVSKGVSGQGIHELCFHSWGILAVARIPHSFLMPFRNAPVTQEMVPAGSTIKPFRCLAMANSSPQVRLEDPGGFSDKAKGRHLSCSYAGLGGSPWTHVCPGTQATELFGAEPEDQGPYHRWPKPELLSRCWSGSRPFFASWQH